MARKILAVSYPRFEDTIGEVGDGTETYAEITRELVDECRAALKLARGE